MYDVQYFKITSPVMQLGQKTFNRTKFSISLKSNIEIRKVNRNLYLKTLGGDRGP